jgi:acylphosphatase
MEEKTQLKARVYGHVQGVCFRNFVQCEALELGLHGYVWNLGSGNAIEVKAEGNRNKLESLIDKLKTGPPGAVVNYLEITWSTKLSHFHEFSIKY